MSKRNSRLCVGNAAQIKMMRFHVFSRRFWPYSDHAFMASRPSRLARAAGSQPRDGPRIVDRQRGRFECARRRSAETARGRHRGDFDQCTISRVRVRQPAAYCFLWRTIAAGVFCATWRILTRATSMRSTATRRSFVGAQRQGRLDTRAASQHLPERAMALLKPDPDLLSVTEDGDGRRPRNSRMWRCSTPTEGRPTRSRWWTSIPPRRATGGSSARSTCPTPATSCITSAGTHAARACARTRRIRTWSAAI